MQIPIVDAHHHLWRKADLPWLSGPMLPRIFGEYEAIRRDYLIEEFRQDMEPCGVVRSVYVQTNWPQAGALDEVGTGLALQLPRLAIQSPRRLYSSAV